MSVGFSLSATGNGHCSIISPCRPFFCFQGDKDYVVQIISTIWIGTLAPTYERGNKMTDPSDVKPTLRTRFESFVRTLDGFESIDVRLKGQEYEGMKRADYLFQGRSFIVEQKTLKANPVDKPQKFATRIMRDRRIIQFGTTSTKRLFSGQPDANELHQRLMLNIAKVIDNDVAHADKQTRDTRQIFGIPAAIGILVILNESAEMLTPELIRYALANSFQRAENGTLKYTQNDGVILISEAHSLSVPGFLRAHPINTFTSPRTTGADKVIIFSTMLIDGWAAFNHAPLLKETWRPFS